MQAPLFQAISRTLKLSLVISASQLMEKSQSLILLFWRWKYWIDVSPSRLKRYSWTRQKTYYRRCARITTVKSRFESLQQKLTTLAQFRRDSSLSCLPPRNRNSKNRSTSSYSTNSRERWQISWYWHRTRLPLSDHFMSRHQVKTSNWPRVWSMFWIECLTTCSDSWTRRNNDSSFSSWPTSSGSWSLSNQLTGAYSTVIWIHHWRPVWIRCFANTHTSRLHSHWASPSLTASRAMWYGSRTPQKLTAAIWESLYSLKRASIKHAWTAETSTKDWKFALDASRPIIATLHAKRNITVSTNQNVASRQ